MNQRFAVQFSTALAFGPTGIIWAFLPIYLRSLNASYFEISLIALLPAIETVVLSPLWGALLYRTGKGSRILLFSFLAQAVGFSSFLFLSSPKEFVIAVALIGLFSSSFVPIYAAMATVASSHYGRAIGKFWVSASLGYASVTLWRSDLSVLGSRILVSSGHCLRSCRKRRCPFGAEQRVDSR